MTNRDVKLETYEPGVWYDWSGGENPVPGRRVEDVVWRADGASAGLTLANIDWQQVIAFRLVEAPADKGSLQPSPSVPGEGHGTGVVAMSAVANFEPEDTPKGFIEWTFVLPSTVEVGAGLYEIRHIRCLTTEERSSETASYAALAKATALEGGQ